MAKAQEKLLVLWRLETRQQLQLEHLKRFNQCAVCSCLIAMKVWVPLSHILRWTPSSTLKELDPKCWILNERET